MKYFLFLLIALLRMCMVFGQHVVLISIDGFRPEMYNDNRWPTPNLQRLKAIGTYADHMKSVFPAYTHPSHAAMITGALPARSGIAYNQPKNSKGDWYWYYDSIKAPTIWSAIKNKGMTTAAIMWPNTVDGDITYNVSEIWHKDHPLDRATVVRQHTIPHGFYEELERGATGKLDSTNMNDETFALDENTARMAAYVFKKYQPNFMAVHFACVDGMEHEKGREDDSVRMAIQVNDRAVGTILDAIHTSGLQDSTTVIVVGDHGFSNYTQVFRANMLIRDLPVKFIAAGGSAFLYPKTTANEVTRAEVSREVITQVKDRLDALPRVNRKLFRFVDKRELDEMGADSAAVFALAANAQSGLVFSGAVSAASTVNNGPGTQIQENPLEGIFINSSGGHHGYDPDQPDMWTGFIAAGAGIERGKSIRDLCVTDIAPLVTALLHVDFISPDGKLPSGVLQRPLAGQDWPNLRRYQKDNAKLKSTTTPKDRVVLMGNSITDFWIRNSPDFFEKNHFIDRGISGQTSPQMLLRFNQDVIALKPMAVVIECGTNDIAGNTGPSSLEMIEDNIASMAQLAHAGGIKVYLGSVLPANRFGWAPKLQPADSIIALNRWLREYARKNNFIYVDYYSALVDEQKGMKPQYSSDGVHPTKEGYEVMEKILLQAMKK